MTDSPSFPEYVRIRQPRLGCVVADPVRIYFPMEGDDGRQLYRTETSGGRTRVSSFDRPVQFVSRSSDGTRLIVGVAGPEESTTLYVAREAALGVDDRTTPFRRIGLGEEVSHRWGTWGPTDERVAFVARTDGGYDAYVQRLVPEPTPPRCVARDLGWTTVHDWRTDGRLLVSRTSSMQSQTLLSVDIATGSVTTVRDPDRKTLFRHPHWAPNGDGAVVVTNADHDHAYVARVTPEAVTPVARADWGIKQLTVTGDRVAYTVNEDGYSVLETGRLGDETVHRTATPVDLPEGVVYDFAFDPTARWLACTYTSSDTPPEIHLTDTETGTTDRVVRSDVATLSRDSFVDSTLVRFESVGGVSVPAYLSVPAATAAPVLIDIHGGPETQRHPVFRASNQYFLDRGYAVLEPNIRGSSGYGREYAALDDKHGRLDAVADVYHAARWLDRTDRIDPTGIVLKGTSYGGFVALSAAVTYSDVWDGIISVSGIANFVTYLQNIDESRRPIREAEYGSLDEDRALLESISPVHDADAIDCPLLVVHGRQDQRVPISEARQILDRTADAGVPVESIIFPDEGHSIQKPDNHHAVMRGIVEFLETHVE